MKASFTFFTSKHYGCVQIWFSVLEVAQRRYSRMEPFLPKVSPVRTSSRPDTFPVPRWHHKQPPYLMLQLHMKKSHCYQAKMRSLCPRTSSNIGNWRDLCKASPAINCISTSLVIGNCFAVYSSGIYFSIVISAPNSRKCLPNRSLQTQNTAGQEANSNAILQLAPEKTSNAYRYKSQPQIKRRHKSFENIWALGFLSQKYFRLQRLYLPLHLKFSKIPSHLVVTMCLCLRLCLFP